MGKGGQGNEVEGENMAAWLVAKDTLKIMPFKLPPLGPSPALSDLSKLTFFLLFLVNLFLFFFWLKNSTCSVPLLICSN